MSLAADTKLPPHDDSPVFPPVQNDARSDDVGDHGLPVRDRYCFHHAAHAPADRLRRRRPERRLHKGVAPEIHVLVSALEIRPARVGHPRAPDGTHDLTAFDVHYGQRHGHSSAVAPAADEEVPHKREQRSAADLGEVAHHSPDQKVRVLQSPAVHFPFRPEMRVPLSIQLAHDLVQVTPLHHRETLRPHQLEHQQVRHPRPDVPLTRKARSVFERTHGDHRPYGIPRQTIGSRHSAGRRRAPGDEQGENHEPCGQREARRSHASGG